MRNLFSGVNSMGKTATKFPAAKSRRSQRSRGAAVVEFAIVAPILFLVVILPTFEFGRGLMVAELATNAARAGCRVGILPGNSNATITSAVSTALTSQGIANITTTVNVNGTVADVSTAATGDNITVTVSVPYDANSWIPGRFLGGTSISGTQTMRRE
jgi:Flp pilus assembly protein TadG